MVISVYRLHRNMHHRWPRKRFFVLVQVTMGNSVLAVFDAENTVNLEKSRPNSHHYWYPGWSSFKMDREVLHFFLLHTCIMMLLFQQVLDLQTEKITNENCFFFCLMQLKRDDKSGIRVAAAGLRPTGTCNGWTGTIPGNEMDQEMTVYFVDARAAQKRES